MTGTPTAPRPRGRWAYTTANTRAMLVCATCGCMVPSDHRTQHGRWHDYMDAIAQQTAQPALFDQEPPF